MARNPHWDETINEDEDIGFRGPHFNAPSRSPQQEWGDVGGGGEFSGSRREEVLPSPNMPGSYRGGPEGWGNYRADEFTGIQSHIPSGRNWFKKLYDMYGGNRHGLGGGFDTPYGGLTPEEKFIQKQQRDLQKENFRDYYYNQYKPGPWNEFDPPSPPPYPSLKQDWGEGLMAYNPGDETSGPIRRPRIKPLTIEEEELDLLDTLEGLEPGDELDPDDYYSDGWDVADTGIGSTNEYQTEANLGNYDLFHLMQNGYSLEEAQQILNEQGLA